MINVAVIHVKDLSKYLVKIGIIFIILFLLTRFLNFEKMFLFKFNFDNICFFNLKFYVIILIRS